MLFSHISWNNMPSTCPMSRLMTQWLGWLTQVNGHTAADLEVRGYPGDPTDLGFQIIALENCFRKPWYLHAFQCHVKNELRLTLLIAEMAKELVKSLFHLISCDSKLVKIVLFSKIVSTWLCDVSSQDGWTLVFFFRQFFSDRLRLHQFIFWIHDILI